jgi:uncharacterized membrane protein YbhN (UPF0104 family)
MSTETERLSHGRHAVVAPKLAAQRRELHERARGVLKDARSHLSNRALKLIAFVLGAILVFQLIPGLQKAFDSLESVSWQWVAAAVIVEAFSESGFVAAWRGVVDPDRLLEQGGRGWRLPTRLAWAQLGGGMVIPGGTFGSMGVGAWMLHRLGMPTKQVADRQFLLMFLNTAIDGLAIIVFGLGLAVGVFSGEGSLLLTLVPAVAVAVLFALAVFAAGRSAAYAERVKDRRPKLSKAMSSLATGVAGAHSLLRDRGSIKIVLGSIAYLLFDVLVLWSAFIAIDADPQPAFAVVAMAYLIGGLAGSIPLPANLGAVGGMAGMLVAYGVGKNPAAAAVVLYQAIGYLVPLIGGGLAYLLVRRQLGPLEDEASTDQDTGTRPQPAG